MKEARAMLSRAENSITGEVDAMPAPIQFRSEVKTVPFGEGTMTIENLTPILSPKEREKRRREIENSLYSVFVKYADGKKK
jgi:hypothetical protein